MDLLKPATLTILFLSLFASSNSEQPKKLTCNKHLTAYTFKEYTVFEKTHNGYDSTDFFVQKSSNQGEICKSELKKSLFQLKNQENAFFLNLTLDYIFIDYGTGPDYRQLSIYNILNGIKILDTTYSDNISLINRDTVSIWFESSDTTYSKCKEHKQWEANGLGTSIVEEYYFDLKSRKFYKTQNWKCIARQ